MRTYGTLFIYRVNPETVEPNQPVPPTTCDLKPLGERKVKASAGIQVGGCKC